MAALPVRALAACRGTGFRAWHSSAELPIAERPAQADAVLSPCRASAWRSLRTVLPVAAAVSRVRGHAPRRSRRSLYRSAVPVRANPGQPGLVSYEALVRLDSLTNDAIMAAFQGNHAFLERATKQRDLIADRDEADARKLQRGIDAAIKKGLLPREIQVEPFITIDSGRDVAAICAEIIGHLGDAPERGCLVVVQGLSGTGKGTTIAGLKDRLPNSKVWSNGNVFRAVTLLAVRYAEQKSCTLDEVLTPENLHDFFAMLEFVDFAGKFDIKIEGLGIRHMASEIQTTVLKEQRIARNVSLVAAATQGEVIDFTQRAVARMNRAGSNVLLDGREQTLNYVRSPHRFELVLSDGLMVGKRQAAGRMAVRALDLVPADASAEQVMEALRAAMLEQ